MEVLYDFCDPAAKLGKVWKPRFVGYNTRIDQVVVRALLTGSEDEMLVCNADARSYSNNAEASAFSG